MRQDSTRRSDRQFYRNGAIVCRSCRITFWPTHTAPGPLCLRCKGLSQLKDAIRFYQLSAAEAEE